MDPLKFFIGLIIFLTVAFGAIGTIIAVLWDAGTQILKTIGMIFLFIIGGKVLVKAAFSENEREKLKKVVKVLRENRENEDEEYDYEG
jgi:hypothetical protein